jgi:nucleoside diphosphate kinase
MLSGESTILLLCNEKEDPIEKWKKMIGNKDPVEAKKEGENLRAIYGESIIKNELHGSDDVFDSNKERDTFRFRIP